MRKNRLRPRVESIESRFMLDGAMINLPALPPGISPDVPPDPPSPPVQLDLSQTIGYYSDPNYFPNGPDAFAPSPLPPVVIVPLDPGGLLNPINDPKPVPVQPPFQPPGPGPIISPPEQFPEEPFSQVPIMLPPTEPEPPDFDGDQPPIVPLPPVPIGPESPLAWNPFGNLQSVGPINPYS